MRNKNKNMSKIKPPKKINMKSQKIKKKVLTKPKKQDVLVVAQEIKFARLLSGNEKKSRDKVLKTMKKWLLNCFQKGHQFKEDDFIRVWKGLFYAVWMSDKPLVQEELCENIAAILDEFPPEKTDYAIMMVKAGFRVLANEWYGIDHHRMDKFLMLVRRYLRGSLRVLRACDWNVESCAQYSNMLSGPDGILAPKTPHYARNATSMILHFVECFLEELAKVSSGTIPPQSTVELLRPFLSYMCLGQSVTLTVACRRLLTLLLRQSEEGIQYEEKTRAWQMMGCPRGGPEAMELEIDENDDDRNTDDSDDEQASDDDGEKPLDPRAGRVDVTLPLIQVPAREISRVLREMLVKADGAAQRRTRICLERFEKLAKNEYPLPVKEVFEENEVPASWKPTKAAKDLTKTEKQLLKEADELALRGLSRKHRKRLLAKSRAGESILEDVAKLKQNQQSFNTDGDWTVESTDVKNNDDNTSNKENVQKKSKKRKNKDAQTESPKKQKLNADEKKLKAEKKKNERKINMIVNKRDNKLKKIQDNLALADSIKTFFENRNKNDNSDVEKTKKDKVKNEPKTIKVFEKPTKAVEKTTKVVETLPKKVKNPTKVVENVAKPEHSVKVGNVKNKVAKAPTVVAKKVKNFQKQTSSDKNQDIQKMMALGAPKKVRFVLKNNSAQLPAQYARAVRSQPAVPYDARRRPAKGNLKTSAPSVRNPFAKKK